MPELYSPVFTHELSITYLSKSGSEKNTYPLVSPETIPFFISHFR